MVEQLLILCQVNSNALSIRYRCEELRRLGVNGGVCDGLPSKSNLLTERRLRYVLAFRRIGEATLLRDSDKVPQLMNLHRRSDTPLGPPVCLRLADRMDAVAKAFGLAVHSGRGTKRGVCGTITLVTSLPSGSLRMNGSR
jgi:hypothetical protein